MAASRRVLRRGGVGFVIAAIVALVGGSAAQATEEVHIVASFDESQGQNTEGVAVDQAGNVFVSVSPLGTGYPPGFGRPPISADRPCGSTTSSGRPCR